MPYSTIKEIYKKSIEDLKKSSLPSPELDAEILICHALKKDKIWFYSNFNKKLTDSQKKNIKRLIKKRAKGIPAAQLTGYKEFYKLDFFINKDVLIPRPETELLVDEALEIIKTKKQVPPFRKGGSGGILQKTLVIDIGVGSGAIIIALAKNISNESIKFFGTEISSRALTIARTNAKKHNVDKKIKFLKGNLLESIIGNNKLMKLKANEAKSYIITANLPYLTPKQLKDEKSIQHEPKLALVSGRDGLKDYRLFFKQLKKLTSNKTTVIIEFDPGQTEKLKKIIKNNLHNAKITTKKDLCGLNRVMIINI